MSCPSFNDAFIEDVDQNNPEVREINLGADSFCIFPKSGWKTSSRESSPSVLKSSNMSSSRQSSPEKFCVWELIDMTPGAKSEPSLQTESITKTSTISLNNSQCVVSSDNAFVSEEVSLKGTVRSLTAVKSQVLDSYVGNTDFEQEKLLDCICETGVSASPSHGSVEKICGAVSYSDASSETSPFVTLRRKTNLRKRKHGACDDVNYLGMDNSVVVENRNVRKGKVKSVPGVSSELNVSNCDVASSNGGSNVLSEENAEECVWEIMSRDASCMAYAADADPQNDQTEFIAPEEINLFSHNLKPNTNNFNVREFRSSVDRNVNDSDKPRLIGSNFLEGDSANLEIPVTLLEFQLDPAMLELGFETSVPCRPTAKRQRRKSVSADQEIARQIIDNSILESELDSANIGRRYSQRLRRRSTDLASLSKQIVSSGLPPAYERESETVDFVSEFNTLLITDSGDAAPSSENFTGVVDVRLGFGSTSQMEQNSLVDGNLVPLDVETSPDSFDLAQFSIPLRASKRLRRHSTELYRAGNNSHCSISLSSLNETSEGNETDILSSKSESPNRNKPEASKQTAKVLDETPLEDIYLNKLWRTQMPKEALWETIHEDPKISKNTGDYKFFSTQKSKRLFDFEEGPSPQRLKLRRQRAVKLGWKPTTKKQDLKFKRLLAKKLLKLDEDVLTLSTSS